MENMEQFLWGRAHYDCGTVFCNEITLKSPKIVLKMRNLKNTFLSRIFSLNVSEQV
jgi:hypothetical protein